MEGASVIYGRPASVWSSERHRFMSAITACPCSRGLVFEEEGLDPLGECTPSAPAFHVEGEGVAFHCALSVS